MTAMEFRLFPIATAFAGMLLWDQAHAAEVLRRWVAWTADAPDSVTTAFRLLNFAEVPTDVSAGYPADSWRRLVGVRSAVDPRGVIRANHPVPPAVLERPSDGLRKM